MRILMLCRRFSPDLGGVERHVEGLSKALGAHGHQVEIIAENSGGLSGLDQIGNTQVHRIPKRYLTSKLSLWYWIWKHRDLFRKADLIHVHDVFWWYFPLRFLFWNKPVYTTFHGYERVEGPTMGALFVRKLSEILSWGAIGIGAWMERWYGHTLERVSYGAATAMVSPLPKKLDAVFIGRLEEDTGILEFIEGVSLLKGKVVLDIYGKGRLMAEIKRRIKGNPAIHIKGETMTPTAKVAEHRFVFSSQYLTMLEAQQVGRQVFSYPSSQLKRDYLDVFPTRGQIVVFNTPKELAAKLEKTINDPKIEARNIKKASVWALKQTWEKLANEYESLWQQSRS